MTINQNKEGNVLTVALEGRLDTSTAPQLESALNASLNGITALVFDLEKLEYISSAGLRVFLTAQKTMNKQGSMVVRNTSADIKDIFDITGFSDILTIE